MQSFRIALIYPYFGRRNSLFDLWLKTCQYNNFFTFFIYTDQLISLPQNANNIIVKNMSFEHFKRVVQDNVDCSIQLPTPYKICDFRPAFGDIFSSDIEGFTHWGYGDTDVILGNMRAFLTDAILEKYDKLFWCGHLCIYKNNDKMNKLYRSKYDSSYPYIEVFSNPNNCIFDEWWGNVGIDEIAMNNNCSVYRDVCFADVNRMFRRSAFDFDFRLALLNNDIEKKINFFEWNRGKLYGYSFNHGIIQKEEYLYAHFQKRSFKIKVRKDTEVFYIVPNIVLETREEAENYYGSKEYANFKRVEKIKYDNWCKNQAIAPIVSET